MITRCFLGDVNHPYPTFTYDCNERYYVCGKAEFANDGKALETVMRAESPSECKKISEGLNRKINVKAWME